MSFLYSNLPMTSLPIQNNGESLYDGQGSLFYPKPCPMLLCPWFPLLPLFLWLRLLWPSHSSLNMPSKFLLNGLLVQQRLKHTYNIKSIKVGKWAVIYFKQLTKSYWSIGGDFKKISKTHKNAFFPPTIFAVGNLAKDKFSLINGRSQS